MNHLKLATAPLAFLSFGWLLGCSSTASKIPDLNTTLRASLDQAGLKGVTSNQDAEKGVITLGGHVPAESDKAQAENLAKSVAGSEVVANEITVIPPGQPDAKTVASDLDKGIGGNLSAALIEAKLDDNIKFTVKNGVVTLTGEVDSKSQRVQGQQVAAAIQNVSQVVNELQVKNQKATSFN
jgi:osmotically-inducible protein OsmY